ncbi:hypothetical protein ACFFGT_05910 [Mucilaginibacter angelicae]|uniref:Uncharacterized protein n=1 Tax=Mucilaginibacter angelicae TaxID=869718 RepID=A0ABV6L2X7_9SPHI
MKKNIPDTNLISFKRSKTLGLFFMFFSSFILNATAQIHLQCGEVNQLIPDFKIDSSGSFSDLLLVKMNILKPIEYSPSAFEIRFFKKQFGSGAGVVISCTNNKLVATCYETAFYADHGVPEGSAFKNIGHLGKDTNSSVLMNLIPYRKPRPGQSWNALIKSLINNHLFNLPQESELDKIVLRRFPKTKISYSEGLVEIELKAGKRIRRMTYSNNYEASASGIQQIKNQHNIFIELSQFLNDK